MQMAMAWRAPLPGLRRPAISAHPTLMPAKPRTATQRTQRLVSTVCRGAARHESPRTPDCSAKDIQRTFLEHLSRRIQTEDSAAIATLATEAVDAVRIVERIDNARYMPDPPPAKLQQDTLNLINDLLTAAVVNCKRPHASHAAAPSPMPTTTKRPQQPEAQLGAPDSTAAAQLASLDGMPGGSAACAASDLDIRLLQLERAVTVQTLQWAMDHAYLGSFDYVVTSPDGRDKHCDSGDLVTSILMAAMRGCSWPLPRCISRVGVPAEGAAAGARVEEGGGGGREGKEEGEKKEKALREVFWEQLRLQVEGLTGVAPLREGVDLDRVRVVLAPRASDSGSV